MGNTSTKNYGNISDEDHVLTLKERENLATDEMADHHFYLMEYSANRDSLVKPEDNSQYEYNYQRLELPKDKEGYCVTFSPDEEEEYLKFFQTYGVVVVRDILTDDECTMTEDEIWEFINRHTNGKVERNDPTTWEYWPQLKQLGILGDTIILSPQCCRNRQNPKLVRVYQRLLGTEDVMVNVGRASAMRSTKNVPINGEIIDKPEWKTISEWLHWDMNPWTGLTTTFSWRAMDFDSNRGYDRPMLQGILSCVNCGPKDGGFQCVPGFQHHIRGWANKNFELFDPQDFELAGSIQVPRDDPIWNDIQTVPMRKGCMLIWSSCLPHGTFPNDSEHGRMIQYIKMARKDDPSIAPLFKNEALLPPKEEFELTTLGRKLLGLDDPVYADNLKQMK